MVNRFLSAVIIAGALYGIADAKELIAYSQLTDGYWQIWTVEPDGGNKQKITDSPMDKRDPVWIKAGKAIAFRTHNGQLFTRDLTTKKEEELLTQLRNIANPYYCNATDEIVFVLFDPQATDVGNIWKSGGDGKNPVVLIRDNILKYRPVFSPRGDKVAFVKVDSSTRSHHLWLMNADGSNPRQLTKGKGLMTLPDFSPDNTTITFTSNFNDNNYEIYTLDIASLKINRLTKHPGLDSHSRFSTDGSKVVFVSNRSGNQQIWVMDKDGSNPKQITDGEAESVSPAWGEIKE